MFENLNKQILFDGFKILLNCKIPIVLYHYLLSANKFIYKDL